MKIDPHEEQQQALLGRICNSVERLADVLEEVNEKLEETEKCYPEIEKAHAVWNNYQIKMGVQVKAKR